MSRRKEFIKLVEGVLEFYSDKQINLSSESARKDVAEAIVSKLEKGVNHGKFFSLKPKVIQDLNFKLYKKLKKSKNKEIVICSPNEKSKDG